MFSVHKGLNQSAIIQYNKYIILKCNYILTWKQSKIKISFVLKYFIF